MKMHVLLLVKIYHVDIYIYIYIYNYQVNVNCQKVGGILDLIRPEKRE
jgi:hypothetical protein